MVTKKTVGKKAAKKTVKTKKQKTVDAVNALLGKLDVAFIIDTTGSMGMFIAEAKAKAVGIIKGLQTDSDLDIQVALVEYRDHQPQDYSFVTRRHDFTNADTIQRSLNGMSANGGGDRPEAVWPGVNDLGSLTWRENSDRIAYLIGDAPPHGYSASFGDAWPHGDPSGITHEQLIEMLKSLGVRLHVHSIANSADTTAAFSLLATATGGEISTGNRAQDTTELYTRSLSKSAGSVTDSRVLYSSTVTANGAWDVDASFAVAESLGWDDKRTLSTIDYLKTRKVSE